MTRSEARVEELVGMIERGVLRLPEMQRRYVWRSTRVRDLLDSLYRGYPSGAILLWESLEDVPMQEMAVSQQSSPQQSVLLLLDGQQRLTSLSAVIRGEPVKVRGRKRPIEILFNLEHPDQLELVTEVDEEEGGEEEDEDEAPQDEPDSDDDQLERRFNRMTFVVGTKKLAQRPQWVKVSEVFTSDGDAEFLKRAGVAGFDDPNYERYSKRLARLRGIRKYVYRMDVLENSLSYQEVTEIFVRVNSLGAKLRSSDLALAQITAKWRNSLKLFEAFQNMCAKKGFELDLGLFLKNLVVFATGQSRFLTVGNQPLETLRAGWDASCKGMEFALNFMRSNVGIESPVLLSSPFILIALAYHAHARGYQVGTGEADLLRHWVLLANAKGRYSRGSSETILDQDLAVLRNQGGARELIERLRQQVGRLDIAPEELEGRNQRSSLFKTMFLAFRTAGAKDWSSSLQIDLDHSGAQHRLQFHHIFPKAKLRNLRSKREADDIANLAFIGGRTNRGISDKAPADYFPPLIAKLGAAVLEAQAIPIDSDLLELDAFAKFVAERRRRIAAMLNAFLASG